jgi:hypothetical protein
MEQHGGMASARQWPGRGARCQRVAAREWRAAGSARCGSTWLTGGPEHDGGPVISSWVRHGAAQWGGRRGVDRWGRQHSEPDSVFKPNQIYFERIQICPKFWLIQNVPSLALKISNKIWIERAFDKEQLSLYKFLQIRNRIWTKIQRAPMSWNSLENSLENLGTLDMDEILPASSWLHLIARKNQFPLKEDKNFEFHSKRYFWIDFAIVWILNFVFEFRLLI